MRAENIAKRLNLLPAILAVALALMLLAACGAEPEPTYPATEAPATFAPNAMGTPTAAAPASQDSPTPTAAAEPEPADTRNALSFEEYLTFCKSVSEEEETFDWDVTNKDVSASFAEDLAEWEAVSPPAEVAEWHDQVATVLGNVVGLFDNLPEDDPLDFETLILAAAMVERDVAEAAANLPSEIALQMEAAGCEILGEGQDTIGGDKLGSDFIEADQSVGTFRSFLETAKVGDYQVLVYESSHDTPGETLLVARITNVGEENLDYPDCAVHMDLQDQAGISYENSQCFLQLVLGHDDIPPGEAALYSLIYQTPEGATGLIWKFSTGTVGADFLLEDLAAVDDHGDDFDSATPISVGVAVDGVLGHYDDTDFFRFTVEKGHFYQVDTTLDTEPVWLEAHVPDADNPGELVWADLQNGWEASASGDSYIAVGTRFGPDAWNGSYTLTITEIVGDHASTIDGATAVSVGEPVEGVIDWEGDLDYFRFTANAGETYRFDVALGTLPDSHVRVLNSEGDVLETPFDRWEAEESGEYYVEVRGFLGEGTYTLTVTLYQ